VSTGISFVGDKRPTPRANLAEHIDLEQILFAHETFSRSKKDYEASNIFIHESKKKKEKGTSNMNNNKQNLGRTNRLISFDATRTA
jgi:hypothetical protein